jgi:hypothetical protein
LVAVSSRLRRELTAEVELETPRTAAMVAVKHLFDKHGNRKNRDAAPC